MATNAQWTVVMEDKMIIKQSGDAANTAYKINDDTFWSQGKFSNIWAIQYGTSNPQDTVEYRDETAHSNWEDANLGDFSEFINRWDSTHLAKLQSDWDGNNLVNEDGSSNESPADKVARLGARPTSYSS
jgi:hypothetical protein